MERILSADDFSFDHLGTPVAVSDLSGQVVWTHRFSPFGKTIELNEDVDGDGVKLTLNLRFPGQYYDAESGLHYNWHRYYNPETGRYVTPDKVQWISEYNYVFNNPLLTIDPLGLCSTMDDISDSISMADRIFYNWTRGHAVFGPAQSYVGLFYGSRAYHLGTEHGIRDSYYHKRLDQGYGCLDGAWAVALLFNSSGRVRYCCGAFIHHAWAGTHYVVDLVCKSKDCMGHSSEVTKRYDAWLGYSDNYNPLDDLFYGGGPRFDIQI